MDDITNPLQPITALSIGEKSGDNRGVPFFRRAIGGIPPARSRDQLLALQAKGGQTITLGIEQITRMHAQTVGIKAAIGDIDRP